MRDRLIELLRKNARNGVRKISEIADDLLYEGVIAPPCRMGEIVYSAFEGEKEIYEGKVFAIGIDENLVMWISVRYTNGLKFYHTAKDFGKTVFLTKAEAEKALRG